MKKIMLIMLIVSILATPFSTLGVSANEEKNNQNEMTKKWGPDMAYETGDFIFNLEKLEIKEAKIDFIMESNINWDDNNYLESIEKVEQNMTGNLEGNSLYTAEVADFLMKNTVYTYNDMSIPILSNNYENTDFFVSGIKVAFEQSGDDIILKLNDNNFYLVETTINLTYSPPKETRYNVPMSGYRYSYSNNTSNKELLRAVNYAAQGAGAASYVVKSAKIKATLGLVSFVTGVVVTALDFYATLYIKNDVYVSNSCVHKGYKNTYYYQYSNYTGAIGSKLNWYYDNTNSYQQCY
ncbi:MAG: hypothetical protein ACRDCZ_05635 [Culicoidibacterales bacterium]